MVNYATGWWIYAIYKGHRIKFPQPFKTEAGAKSYINRTKKHDKPGITYQIIHGSRRIAKGMKARSS